MKMNSPKINKGLALKISLQVVFVLVLAYEAFLLKGLYSTLTQDNYDFSHAAKSRTDFSDYDKASARYQQSLNYSPSSAPVLNPFGKPPSSLNIDQNQP